MADRFLLQPNGKLASFSTIVDNFTHCNLTKEEAFAAAFEDMGRSEADGKVARGLARGLEAQGGWNECLETIRVIHGPDTCAAVVAEILGGASSVVEAASFEDPVMRDSDPLPRPFDEGMTDADLLAEYVDKERFAAINGESYADGFARVLYKKAVLRRMGPRT